MSYPNGTVFATHTSESGGFNLSGPGNLSLYGNYTALLWANDTAGNIASLSETFTVNDTYIPGVNFTDPTLKTGSNINDNYIFVNVSSSDRNSEHSYRLAY